MTHYAWLAENGELGDKLRYRTWKDGMPAWTANPYEAIWYCRKVDTDKAHEEDSKVKAIVEHAFHDNEVSVFNDNDVSGPLYVRFDSDAGDNLTAREYLKKLLITLWKEGENFNAKRPFGNSVWQYDLYKALVDSGFINGTIDDEGDLHWVDIESAEEFVENMIEEAFK